MFMLIVGAALAQEGSVEGFAEVRWIQQLGVSGTSWQAVQRVRPTFEAELSDRWTAVGTIDAQLAQGRRLQSELQDTVEGSFLGDPQPFLGDQSVLEAAGCAWPDPPANEFLGIDGPGDVFLVDRLFVDAYLPAADLRVGRQAVQWGSALLINPTDPFPQVLFAEPWRFRAGLNSARLTVPLGNHQVQGFLGTSDTFDAVRAAGRGTLNVAATDVSAVGAWRGETGEGLVGLDVRGTLGVGFWFEGALHLPSARTPGPDAPWEELAVGVDYSFPVLDQLLVAAQYVRNGSGGDAAGLGALAGAVELPTCTEVPEGQDDPLADLLGPTPEANPYAPFLSGRDYLLLFVQAQVVDELGVGAVGLQNLGDGTAFVVPTVTVRPNGWLELAASGQVPLRTWGDGGEFSPREEDLRFSVDSPVLSGTLDLSGLAPDASVFGWVRASF